MTIRSRVLYVLIGILSLLSGGYTTDDDTMAERQLRDDDAIVSEDTRGHEVGVLYLENLKFILNTNKGIS